MMPSAPELREQQVAGAFVALAGASLQGEEELLRVVGAQCVETVPADGAAVTLADDSGPPRPGSVSDGRCLWLESGQRRLAQGPSWDVARTGTGLPEMPLAHPHCRARWPHFTPTALALGIQAVTALPLRHGERTLGALTLYHHRPGRLTAAGRTVAQALADTTALALVQQRVLARHRDQAAQLQQALDSRIVIEQAKGILAERLECTPDDAFALLRKLARGRRQKLVTLARDVIDNTADLAPLTCGERA